MNYPTAILSHHAYKTPNWECLLSLLVSCNIHPIDSHGFSMFFHHELPMDSMLTPRIWDDLPQLSHKIAMNLLGKTSLWIYGLAMFSPWFTSDPTVYLLELVDFCWVYSTHYSQGQASSSCLPGAVSEGQAGSMWKNLRFWCKDQKKT